MANTATAPAPAPAIQHAPEPRLAALYSEALRMLRPFWPLAAFASALGVGSGLATAALLATLNRAISASHAQLVPALLAFAGLCVVVLGAETVAAVGNSIVGQRVIAQLRSEIVRKIATAPISALQRETSDRLLATLGHDVDTISAFTFNVSGFFVAVAITLGCLVYLAWLSPWLFLVVALALALAIAINLRAGTTWIEHYEYVRDAQDELQKGYSAITQGAKELRLNRGRRARVFRDQLEGPIARIRDHKVVAMRAFWAARAFGGISFFAVLGVIVALGAIFQLERGVVSGFALVLLYVKGPLEQVIGELPSLGQAQVAFRRVTEITTRLANPEPHLSVEPGTSGGLEPAAIALRGATYTFPVAESSSAIGTAARTFALGPIDLGIKLGETLFITGENGCGKTTLLMLLLGLYEPTSGEVLLGDVPITAALRDEYRQLFSTVLFDYTLFADLVGEGSTGDGLVHTARRYLEQLDLSEKVSIIGDPSPAFSTIDLSAGQRKRLALVQAYLENRPILVFDEWAAEQDPTFRRTFYTEILPDLKREGRTLIVVSHDDRYFDVADRRISLHEGRIVEDTARSNGFAKETEVTV